MPRRQAWELRMRIEVHNKSAQLYCTQEDFFLALPRSKRYEFHTCSSKMLNHLPRVDLRNSSRAFAIVRRLRRFTRTCKISFTISTAPGSSNWRASRMTTAEDARGGKAKYARTEHISMATCKGQQEERKENPSRTVKSATPRSTPATSEMHSEVNGFTSRLHHCFFLKMRVQH